MVVPRYPLDGESDPNGIAQEQMLNEAQNQNKINNPGGGSRKKKHKGGNNVPGKVEVNVPVGGRDNWGNDPRKTIMGGTENLLAAQSDSSQDRPNQPCTGGGLKRKKKSKKNKRKSKRKGKTKRKTKRKRKSKRKSKRKIKRK